MFQTSEAWSLVSISVHEWLKNQEPRCLEDCVVVSSANVRQMLRDGNPEWKSFVPEIVLKQGPWAA